MTTIFSKIINGEIPGSFVHRDETCVAFMTINPISEGHLLVVPIVEVDHWIDLDDVVAAHLFAVSKRIAALLPRLFPCNRVGMIIAGYEIDHCHIHLIPTRSMADLDFRNAAGMVDRQVLEDHAKRIREALSEGQGR